MSKLSPLASEMPLNCASRVELGLWPVELLNYQSHFTQIAYGSLMELACQLTVAADLGYVSMVNFEDMRLKISHLANKLNALRSSQLARVAK